MNANRWTTLGDTSVRGVAFISDRRLEGESLAHHFENVTSFRSFLDACRALNGFFAVTQEREHGRYAAIDRIRSIPIYYTVDGSGRIGDSVDELVNDVRVADYDPFTTSELLTSMHVTGPDTLVESVNCLRPGEALHIRDRSEGQAVSKTTYAEYAPGMDGTSDAKALLSEFDDVMRSTAERLARVADGRTIAVPLSGGFDSRLVVLSLATIEYDDVLTFSYGERSGAEAQVSRQVADDLDFPWAFVEYSPAVWREWYRTEGERFYRETFDYDCIVNDGFAPALARLLHRGTISSDTVVAPGQSVASMSEHFPQEALDRPANADRGSYSLDRTPVDYIVDRWFDLWRWRDERFESHIRSKIENQLDWSPTDGPEAAVRAYETWEWRERNTKYINRDARQHEFYGLDWWYPLWDCELADFWATVPLELRRDKELVRLYVSRKYEELTGVSDAPSLPENEPSTSSNVKERLSRSVFGPLLREFYWRFRRRRADSHLPLARHGVLPEDIFERYYTGRETIQSFQALVAAGRLSIDPPAIHDPPRAGLLRLPTETVADGEES